MRKELKSNYARINEKIGHIELLEIAPSANGLDTIIKDCKIHFDKNNNCIVSGYKWQWGFAFEKTFLYNLQYGVIDSHKKFGYETLLDRWIGLQSAYVEKGWHRKAGTTHYNAIFSTFFISL